MESSSSEEGSNPVLSPYFQRQLAFDMQEGPQLGGLLQDSSMRVTGTPPNNGRNNGRSPDVGLDIDPDVAESNLVTHHKSRR